VGEFREKRRRGVVQRKEIRAWNLQLRDFDVWCLGVGETGVHENMIGP
jgi:hypothetical protein